MNRSRLPALALAILAIAGMGSVFARDEQWSGGQRSEHVAQIEDRGQEAQWRDRSDRHQIDNRHTARSRNDDATRARDGVRGWAYGRDGGNDRNRDQKRDAPNRKSNRDSSRERRDDSRGSRDSNRDDRRAGDDDRDDRRSSDDDRDDRRSGDDDRKAQRSGDDDRQQRGPRDEAPEEPAGGNDSESRRRDEADDQDQSDQRDQNSQSDQRDRRNGRPAVSLDQAVAMAERRFNARVVRAEAQRENNHVTYVLRLLNDAGRVWTVRFDAESGRWR
jgi:hypothetical protein